MLPFHQAAESDFLKVNELIVEQLHSEVGMVENIGHYIIEAGGKRLRPLLVLLSAKSCGYAEQQHIPLAAVIEFIHTATLLHDDVVDTSELRRGRTTANAKWGNAPSVLVGDFLYSRAFQMLVAIGNMDIMRIIADATNIISEGEVQQLINAGNPDISEADYYQVIKKKTAQLFEAATHTGAVLSGADRQVAEQLRVYGYHVGMAFQLVDDVLDYQGASEDLGKNVGDDLAEGKPTLPLLYTLKNGNRDEQKLVRAAIEQGSAEHLEAIVEAISRCGALDYTLEQARRHAAQALDYLVALSDSAEKTALEKIARFSVERSY